MADNQEPSDEQVTDVEATEAETKDQDTQDAEEAALVEEVEKEVDKAAPKPTKPKHDKLKSAGVPGKLKHLATIYWAKKKLTIPATVLVLLLLIFAIPYTRYNVLGLFLKSSVTVTVVDSKTNTPVSAASVSLKGETFKTDSSGKTISKVKLGSGSLQITKQYYQTASKSVTVKLSNNAFKLTLVATGRQVPVTVTNKITGKPVANASVKVLHTEAKTDKFGKAVIVLPIGAATQKGTVERSDFNTASITVQVTDQVVATNTFSITPEGKLYFLSNQSGKIDVVKTNLDGTERQTVLAGTGHEDQYSTALLASRDWRYLALLAKRSGDRASVYLIDTSNDQLTTIDEGNASFTLVGWANDSFAYYVNRDQQPQYQAKGTAIKTFDAKTKKLTVVYETGASGDANNYAHENLQWIQEIGTHLVWFTNWQANQQYYTYSFPNIDGKQAMLVDYDVATTNRKTVKAYPISGTSPNYTSYYSPVTSYQAQVYRPNSIYFTINNSSSNDAVYDEYEDTKLTENSKDAADYFQNYAGSYTTYLASPSNQQTFWSEERDGKNALFIGDTDGGNSKQIATLSEYSPYGWYTDNYLLVSKSASELYAMAPDGSGTPFKISDYYKPPNSYRGYGGGYGGL